MGNICQHWDRLANTVIEREPKLIAQIVLFLNEIVKNEEQLIEVDAKITSSNATIIMALYALRYVYLFKNWMIKVSNLHNFIITRKLIANLLKKG